MDHSVHIIVMPLSYQPTVKETETAEILETTTVVVKFSIIVLARLSRTSVSLTQSDKSWFKTLCMMSTVKAWLNSTIEAK